MSEIGPVCGAAPTEGAIDPGSQVDDSGHTIKGLCGGFFMSMVPIPQHQGYQGQNQGYPQNGKRCDNRWHWGPESGSPGPLYLAHLSPLSYHSTHESAKVTAKIVMTAVTKDERWPCHLQEFPQDLSDEEVPQVLSHLPLSRQRPRGHANMIRQLRARA